MYKISVMLLVWCLSIHIANAGKILSKEYSIEQKDDIFYVNLITTVAGDFDKTVKRLTDFANYDKYGLEYLKEIRVVTDNEDEKILWTHMQAFAMTTKYYSKIDIDRKSDRVSAKFKLVPKKGPYHEDHMYDHFSGHTTIEKLPDGKNNQEQYKLHFSMKLKIDPNIPRADFLIRYMLRKFANHTVRALLVF